MTGSRNAWMASLAMTVVAFVAVALLYGRLPDPMPTHWNLSGEADGFTPKPWGPFALPILMAGALLLFAILPRISPKGYRIEPFAPLYGFLVLLVTTLVFALNGVVLAEATGHGIGMARAFGVVFGAFSVLLGNYLPKVRRNFWIGIRTPWTLASEENWATTHRFAGRTFVLGGAATLIAALLGAPAWLIFSLIIAAALAPAVYSFVIWRSTERPNGNDATP